MLRTCRNPEANGKKKKASPAFLVVPCQKLAGQFGWRRVEEEEQRNEEEEEGGPKLAMGARDTGHLSCILFRDWKRESLPENAFAMSELDGLLRRVMRKLISTRILLAPERLSSPNYIQKA